MSQVNVRILIKDDCVAHIHSMENTGKLGLLVGTLSMTSGWTQACPFIVSGKQFLFLMKGGTGETWLRPVMLDGCLGPEVERNQWSKGWTTATFYTVGGETFLFLLKAHGSVCPRVHSEGLQYFGTDYPVQRLQNSRHW